MLRRALPLLCTAAPLLAGGRDQAPDAPWRTLATAHYRIHYPARGSFEPFAQDVAGRIEAIHAEIAKLVGYEHPGPVDVVIRDPRLEANGSAFAFLPRPSVELWRTPPEEDSELAHSRGWTELLVAHELTHIQHLSRPQEGPDFIERLFPSYFGPLAMKAPRWVSEGYATLIEGRATGSGRPHSPQRAAVLREWAREGRLPAYGQLSSFGGYRGGSMAYLVGSAYLEWLERREPGTPDLLQRFWTQLASGKHRDFEASFRAAFGISAEEGYRRFSAELAHDALEAEQRLKARGLREGVLWARFNGEVGDLAVSPDGTKLLARVLDPKHPGLYVWDLTKQAQPAEPSEDHPVEAQRRADWVLPRIDGALPWKPRWSAAGTVAFELRLPGRDGALEPRGYHWIPGGDFRPAAIEAAPARAPAIRCAAVEGIWNLLRKDSDESEEQLTRTTSAMWDPAPTPDGKALFCLRLTATGTEIRRLSLELPPLEDHEVRSFQPLAPDAVLPPADEPGRIAASTAPPPASPYRVGESMRTLLRVGADFSPSAKDLQLGLGGSDVLGRLDWQLLAGLGEGPGPKGFDAGLAWRGWRFAPSLSLFADTERPSQQQFLPVQGFDRKRRGGELAFDWEDQRVRSFSLRPLLAMERVRDEASGDATDRGLAGLELALGRSWGRGEELLHLRLHLLNAKGRSEGQSWSLYRHAVEVSWSNPLLPLRLKAEWGRVEGEPTALDRFQLGGAPTSLVPASLDWNRVEQIALPQFSATGDRMQRFRGELGGALRGYLDYAAVWDAASPRAPYQRVAGLELHLDELWDRELAARLLGRAKLVLGLHRPLDGPVKDRSVATLSFLVRP